ncbi:cytochrome C biogenesis protein [Methylobacterium variabile]|jgi:cytochrome c-type biogenesis protein|uniref:Cytochrome C biogenesis protein n=1 Tax=Methylobacterium variabile TaxID=298794 RepID=A0A0J6TBG9_9HYPH|nr:cytochrome c biogenesis protein CcdA [Methylobacterium variabile]KMO42978.1 cytochrome C biogenesis protein [Methylobacterium variabile]
MAIDAASVGLLAAFAAGAASFLSPCVLPLVPGYVSYVAGQSAAGERGSLRTLGLSLCFVLGFTTVFVAFGAGASAVGFALLAHREALNLASGLLVILFGLFTAGLLRPAWLQGELRWHGDPPGRGPVAAYLLGMTFAFGWTPCIGPVLGAILAVTASSASGKGVVLLTVYSLGLGVPFVAAALFLSGFVARLRTLRWVGRALQVAGGGVMVAMGLLMVTGRMTDMASLIMETFPALGRIG